MFYPLVSVIIPVYQAEKFLTECVESVRKQDYSELEIVLVNDGSTDQIVPIKCVRNLLQQIQESV